MFQIPHKLECVSSVCMVGWLDGRMVGVCHDRINHGRWIMCYFYSYAHTIPITHVQFDHHLKENSIRMAEKLELDGGTCGYKWNKSFARFIFRHRSNNIKSTMWSG